VLFKYETLIRARFKARHAETDSIINISSSNPFEDQQLLIVSKRRDIPILIPGLSKVLGGKLQSDVKGIAVVESKP